MKYIQINIISIAHIDSRNKLYRLNFLIKKSKNTLVSIVKAAEKEAPGFI